MSVPGGCWRSGAWIPTGPRIGDYDRMSEWRVSTTDPDATPMRTGAGTDPGYHDHYVVDGGKRRIILAAFVTPADVTDNMPMQDLLWRVCFRRKIWPHQVTGDAKYGTTENIVAIEDAGIRAYVPLPDFEHRTAFYGRDTFTYDAERDDYRCPEGQPLPRYRAKHTEEVVVYRADAATCNACPVKAACTDSEHGRTIQRSDYADVPGEGAGLPRDRGLQEGDAQAEGVGRTPLRRGQGLARPAATSLTRAGEREHPGAPDRRGAEPEAFLGSDGLGAASCPVWQPRGPPERSHGRLQPSPGDHLSGQDGAHRIGQTLVNDNGAARRRLFSTVAHGPAAHDRSMKTTSGWRYAVAYTPRHDMLALPHLR